MKKWGAWALALVVWNLTFDHLVRREGEAFVERQLAVWRAGAEPPLLAEAFTPRVGRSAVVATGLTLPVVAAGLFMGSRRAPRRDR